jgi:hypothetical protein
MVKKKELDMEGKLNSSAMSDEPPIAQDRQNSQKQKADDLPLTQTDAFAMLASALNQCKRAGISWTFKKQGDYLLIALPKADIANTGNGELGILPVMAS